MRSAPPGLDADKLRAALDDPSVRERFGLFLIGWLGGPQDYIEQHGHPRLRMRHGRVPVDAAMRDAWLRCMYKALDVHDVQGHA